MSLVMVKCHKCDFSFNPEIEHFSRASQTVKSRVLHWCPDCVPLPPVDWEYAGYEEIELHELPDRLEQIAQDAGDPGTGDLRRLIEHVCARPGGASRQALKGMIRAAIDEMFLKHRLDLLDLKILIKTKTGGVEVETGRTQCAEPNVSNTPKE